jgi:hypothetical protein
VTKSFVPLCGPLASSTYKFLQFMDLVIRNLMSSHSLHSTPTQWASIAAHAFPTVITPEQCLILQRTIAYLSRQSLPNCELLLEVLETIGELIIGRQSGNITEMEQSMDKLPSLFPVSLVLNNYFMFLIIYHISSETWFMSVTMQIAMKLHLKLFSLVVVSCSIGSTVPATMQTYLCRYVSDFLVNCKGSLHTKLLSESRIS